MTLSPSLTVQLAKEFRGIAPAWVSSAVVIVAAGVLTGLLFPGTGASGLRSLGIAGYVVGTIAMGALAVGHEYGHRTLDGLLAQPVARQRLLLTKLGVLVPLLASVGVVAWFLLLDAPGEGRAIGFGRSPVGSGVLAAVLALPLLCALFLAPWLTMLCRNPLAGIVFSLAVPGLLWLAGEVAGIAQYGLKPVPPGPAAALQVTVFAWGMAAVIVGGALGGWGTFMRLQAVDRQGAMHTPRLIAMWRSSSQERPARRRSVHWLILKKEVHLQHLTLVVSALYALGVLVLVLVGWLEPDFQRQLVFAMTMIHAVAIPLLAGSLASAEERQFGTVESDALLPMPAWTAWSIKLAVTMGLAVVLSLGLPWLLRLAVPSLDMMVFRMWRPRTIGVVLFGTALALYVSSLSRSGVRALLVAMPAAFCAGAVTELLLVLNARAFRPYDVGALLGAWPNPYQNRLLADIANKNWPVQGLLVMGLAALAAGLAFMLARFALINHRSAERGSRRIWRQARAVAAYLAVGLTLWTTAFALFRQPIVERMDQEIRIIRERARQQAIENRQRFRGGDPPAR
jgi:hypothetical protein